MTTEELLTLSVSIMERELKKIEKKSKEEKEPYDMGELPRMIGSLIGITKLNLELSKDDELSPDQLDNIIKNFEVQKNKNAK